MNIYLLDPSSHDHLPDLVSNEDIGTKTVLFLDPLSFPEWKQAIIRMQPLKHCDYVHLFEDNFSLKRLHLYMSSIQKRNFKRTIFFVTDHCLPTEIIAALELAFTGKKAGYERVPGPRHCLRFYLKPSKGSPFHRRLHQFESVDHNPWNV